MQRLEVSCALQLIQGAAEITPTLYIQGAAEITSTFKGQYMHNVGVISAAPCIKRNVKGWTDCEMRVLMFSRR
jgi:hypothetical protein